MLFLNKKGRFLIKRIVPDCRLNPVRVWSSVFLYSRTLFARESYFRQNRLSEPWGSCFGQLAYGKSCHQPASFSVPRVSPILPKIEVCALWKLAFTKQAFSSFWYNRVNNSYRRWWLLVNQIYLYKPRTIRCDHIRTVRTIWFGKWKPLLISPSFTH